MKVLGVIGRGSDFYGPEVLVSTLGARVIGNLLAGNKSEVIGKIDVPHSHIFIDDFAKGLVTLAEKQYSLGQVWHIPCAPSMTTKELIELASEEASLVPKFLIASPLLIKFLGLFNKRNEGIQ